MKLKNKIQKIFILLFFSGILLYFTSNYVNFDVKAASDEEVIDITSYFNITCTDVETAGEASVNQVNAYMEGKTPIKIESVKTSLSSYYRFTIKGINVSDKQLYFFGYVESSHTMKDVINTTGIETGQYGVADGNKIENNIYERDYVPSTWGMLEEYHTGSSNGRSFYYYHTITISITLKNDPISITADGAEIQNHVFNSNKEIKLYSPIFLNSNIEITKDGSDKKYITTNNKNTVAYCTTWGDGKYVVNAKSRLCSTTQQFTFYINTLKPVLNLNVSDGGKINTAITFSATPQYPSNFPIAKQATILNIKIYKINEDSSLSEVYSQTDGNESTFQPTEDGTYKIITTQGSIKSLKQYEAISQNEQTFIYKTTKPKGSFENEQTIINNHQNIEFSFTHDEKTTLKINSNVISSGYKNYSITIKNTNSYIIEGKNIITLTDSIGNISIYEFFVDRIDPTGDFDQTICSPNQSANFSWSEENITLKIYDKNNENFIQTIALTSSKNINVFNSSLEAGNYYLRIYDTAGNYSSYKYTQENYFDTIITQTKNYINDDNICNFTWDNGKELNIKIIGKNMSGANVEQTITSTDKVTIVGNEWLDGIVNLTFTTHGNLSKTLNITIDKTQPVINLIDKKYYQSATVNWEELNLKSAFYTFNSSTDKINLTKGQTLTEDGKYTITIVDLAENSSTITCYVDNTPVEIISYQENYYYYNQNQKVVISDNNLPTSEISYYFSNDNKTQKILLDYTNSKTSQTFTESGKYELHIFDLSNNETTLIFYIDKETPEITGITNGAYYNSSPQIEWNDNYGIQKITLDDNEFTLWNEVILTEGSHILSVTDLAGNVTSIQFYYDTTAPIVFLKDNLGNTIESKSTINSMQKFKILTGETENINADFYDSTGLKIENVIFDKYYLPEDFSEGEAYFLCKDLAGNITKIIIYIDYTPITYNVYVYGSKQDIKQYYNTNISINWDEDGATAYLKKNDSYEIYSKNSIIETQDNTTKSFQFYIVDAAGNSSDTFSFTIDKEKDYGNYNYLSKQNYNKITEWWNTYTYVLANQKLNIDKYYSFSSEEEALTFARDRELQYVEKILFSTLKENDYQSTNFGKVSCYAKDKTLIDTISSDKTAYVYIYRDLNSPSTMCYYISTANYEAAVQYYTENSVNKYYRYFDDDSNIAEAYNEKLYVTFFAINKNSYTLNKQEIDTTIEYKTTAEGSYKKSATLSGSSSGYYYVRETDRANNIIEYIVILDIIPTNYTIQTAAGIDTIKTNNLKNNKEIYVKEDITILATEEYVTTKITKDSGVEYYNNKSFTINSNGTYTFFGYDLSGNKSESYTIYMNKTELEINFSIEYDSDDQYSGLNLTISNNDITSNDFVEFIVKKDNVVITTDDLGFTFKQSKKQYYFNVSGNYTCQIIDIFGNDIIAEATLSLNAPVGYLYCNDILIQDNGYITCEKVYLDWNSEKSYTATLNGKSYSRNSWITTDGEYTILLINGGDIDNAKTFTFTIDTKKPIGYINVNGEKKDGNSITTASIEVSFTWDDTVYNTATLNDIPYESGTIISKEGTNTIVLTSKSGVKNEYIISLDYTAPEAKIYAGGKEINNNSITNKKIYFSWSESKCTATVNGVTYSSGTIFKESGTYTLLLSDRYGNSAVYSVTIDLSEPTISIYNADSSEQINFNSKINHAFFLDWIDEEYTVYVDNVLYVRGSTINAEKNAESYKDEDKKYTISVINAAGTKIEKYIYLSYLEPTYTLYSGSTQILSGSYTNKSISLEANKLVNYIKVNNQIYTSGQKISQDGIYEFTIYGIYGTNVTATVTIDKQNPIVELVNVENSGYTNKPVFVLCDENVTATYSNGNPYELGSEITKDGSYCIIITDLAGNSTTVNFTILTEQPTYTISSIVYNDKYVNSNFMIDSKSSIYCNGEIYTSGTILKEEKTYNFIITDKANNSVSFQIIYDKTPATYTITGLNENSCYTNKEVTIEFEEDCRATLNNEEYISGTKIELSGTYTFVCYDLAENKTEYTFYISKEKPKGQLFTKTGNISNEAKTNEFVAFTWDDDSTVLCDGNTYEKNTFIKEDGIHSFIIQNIYGNQEIYTVDICTAKPEGTLIGVENNGYTNTPVKFNYDESLYTAQLNDFYYSSEIEIVNDGAYKIKLMDEYGNQTIYEFKIKTTSPTFFIEGIDEGKTKTAQSVYIRWDDVLICKTLLNGKEYLNGSRIYSENSYIFECWDLYGNYAFYDFEISKVLPDYEVVGFSKFATKTNENVIFKFDSSCSATVNGIKYYSGSEISETDNYEFIITNDIGVSDSFKFSIYKLSPIYTLSTNSTNGFVDGGTNGTVTITWNSKNYTCYVNDKEYINGKTIREEGNYNVQIFDELGNVSEFQFVITQEKPTYSIYGLSNEEKMYTNKPFYIEFDSTCLCEINGEVYSSNTEIQEDGIYKFNIKNKYGTEEEFTIICDTQNPSSDISFKANFILDEEKEIYFTNGQFILSWGNDTENVMINGKEFDVTTHSFSTKEDGTYFIILSDLAKNDSYYQVQVITHFNEPVLETTQNCGFLKDNKTNGIVTLSSKENELKAKITSNSEENDYEFGSPIEQEGDYSIIVQDFLGNVKEYSFSISRILPNPTLINVQMNGYTNKDVKITWEENIISSYYVLNNDETTQKDLESGKIFKEDGIYSVVMTNDYGNILSFMFEKNTMTFDYGILVGVEENGYCEKFNYYWNQSDILVKAIFPDGKEIQYTENHDVENQLEFVEDGRYEFYVENKFGNISHVSCVIDTIFPAITGIMNNEKTNSSVILSIEEENIKSIVRNTLSEEGEIIQSKEIQDKEFRIASNGIYSIIVEDMNNHITILNFEIHEEDISKYSKNNIILSDETIDISKIDYAMYSVYINGELQSEPVQITEPGDYEIEIVDLYGNSYKNTYSIAAQTPTNYTKANVFSIIVISGIVLIAVIIFIKKVKNGSKNIYKM